MFTTLHWIALPLPLALFAIGCAEDLSKSSKGGKGSKDGTQVAQVSKADGAAKTEKKVHDHSGWWCDEHGIPEEECSMCSRKAALAFKKKGDWCKKHDRALSQCFICNPKQREFYAAKYRAKYDAEPPPIEDDDKAGKDEKK